MLLRNFARAPGSVALISSFSSTDPTRASDTTSAAVRPSQVSCVASRLWYALRIGPMAKPGLTGSTTMPVIPPTRVQFWKLVSRNFTVGTMYRRSSTVRITT